MSNKPDNLYSKPLLFTVAALVVILVGSIITAFIPLALPSMSGKSEMSGTEYTKYTAIQLAGRDVYRKESCTYCHTQVVRPLKSDVVRYGAYSEAYESEGERPFLWGSRRTGPDIARLYNKYPDEWHKEHLLNPKSFAPKTAMPAYTWLGGLIDADFTREHGRVLGLNFSDEEIAALAQTTELDALVAYLQSLGRDNRKPHPLFVESIEVDTIKGGDSQAGRQIFGSQCASCHSERGPGKISSWGFDEYDYDAETTFLAIANGIEGGMPMFINTLTKEQVVNVIAYIRSLKSNSESMEMEEEGN